MAPLSQERQRSHHSHCGAKLSDVIDTAEYNAQRQVTDREESNICGAGAGGAEVI